MTSSFDWFTVFSVSFVIGWTDYFGFGFTTLDWKLLSTDTHLIYYTTEKIINAPVSICAVVQIKNYRSIDVLTINHSEVSYSVIK